MYLFRKSFQFLHFRHCRLYVVKIIQPPRITIPHKVYQKIKKLEDKHAQLKEQEEIRIKSYGKIPLITCKNPKLNQYKGQRFSKYEPIPLASLGWCHRRSPGDYFTIHCIYGNPSIIASEEDAEDNGFDKLGINNIIFNCLKEMNIKIPTNTQVLTIPHILSGENILCTAETGSGKTLAYLLPLIQRLFESKDENHSAQLRSLVLLPNRELAKQVAGVAEKLCRICTLENFVLIGGQMEFQPIPKNIDLLVTTPGIFQMLLKKRVFNLKNVRYVVIDEVDTMLDDSFNKDIISILRKMGIQDSTPETKEDVNGVQLILIGATKPRGLEEILNNIVDMDALTEVKTNFVNKLNLNIPHQFMRVSSRDRASKCLQLAKRNSNKHIRTMIFCNRIKTCHWLSLFLKENQVENINLNGSMSYDARESVFNDFQKGKNNILVCTDIASRGLDTTSVQSIINFEFPRFASDYIHRAGRTGRVGSKKNGYIFNFVTYRKDVELTQKIEASARKFEELPNVNANIKRKLQSRYNIDE